MKRLVVALCLLLLVSARAEAAFGLDDTAFNADTAETVDVTIDIPGDLLLCFVSYVDGATTVDSVTLGPGGVGQALTQLNRNKEDNNTGFVVEAWYRKAPNTGSGQTVRSDLSQNNTHALTCASFTDADQTTTFRTVAESNSEGGGGDTHTATVTTVSGDIVVGHIITQQSADDDMGQTNIGFDLTTGTIHASAYRAATTTSTSITFTKAGGGSQHWALTAVGVIPSGGGGGGGTTCHRALLGVGC